MTNFVSGAQVVGYDGSSGKGGGAVARLTIGSVILLATIPLV